MTFVPKIRLSDAATSLLILLAALFIVAVVCFVCIWGFKYFLGAIR